MMLRDQSYKRGTARALTLYIALLAALCPPASAQDQRPLTLTWKDNYLTIRGEQVSGGPLRIHYLEAYCRPGSTDRDWHETVIPHSTKLLRADSDGRRIDLMCTLEDGLTVMHQITSSSDEVDFRLIAHNPTDKASQAHWAQPCIRAGTFTGKGPVDYVPKCFIFLDGKQARMPTEPWAMKARYVPGQVWRPRGVDRNDVNPRPLSERIPSSGLIGCYSADERQLMAVAWEPYQELFQGVAACIHSDFRLGGLKPGETRQIRGKIYFLPADVPALVARYERDFPEQRSSAAPPTEER